jgi:hypothetical protein
MIEGYVYCASNPDMPGILKIGMTTKTPTESLKDANKGGTWTPPSPYKLVFAKKVPDISIERKIFILLEKYHCRIHPRKQFFRVKIVDVLDIFNLIEGDFWQDDDAVTDKDKITSEKSSEPNKKRIRVDYSESAAESDADSDADADSESDTDSDSDSESDTANE